jgi:hypothetical protein
MTKDSQHENFHKSNRIAIDIGGTIASLASTVLMPLVV